MGDALYHPCVALHPPTSPERLEWATSIDLNEYAEANELVVYYPQAKGDKATSKAMPPPTSPCIPPVPPCIPLYPPCAPLCPPVSPVSPLYHPCITPVSPCIPPYIFISLDRCDI